MIGQIACASGAAAISARGAAVGEDIGVLRHIEEGVERDRDAAGAHRAPERHRIIDRVVQQQRDAFLLPDAERAQRIGEADGARLQVAVAERAVGIDERDLFGEAARHVGVDEIGDGIVGAALG